ncbi:MAG: hypothetical protein NT135_00700 [Candidatus Berkelbacteria bacterium]|nr:hypothetical protein [Candidatus Berkelbacteria bacterium]
MKKILVVHGYEVSNNGRYDALVRCLCHKVVEIHERYDAIVLLGGLCWRQDPYLLEIAKVMRAYLIKLGVPEDKLYTRLGLGCYDCHPPRDIIEEVDLLPIVIRALGQTPRYLFDVVAFWDTISLLRLIYEAKGRSMPPRFIKVFSSRTLLPLRMIREILIRREVKRDPYGKSGRFNRDRAKITFAAIDGSKPLISENWQ